MQRRQVIQSMSVLAMAAAVSRCGDTPPENKEAPAGGQGAAVVVKPTLSLLCRGLWAVGDVAGTPYLSAVDASKTPLPEAGPNVYLHAHTPLVILPDEALLNYANYDLACPDERQKWGIPATGNWRKVPLKPDFAIKGLDEPFNEYVVGTFPVVDVNANSELDPDWYKTAGKVTAYTIPSVGRLRSTMPFNQAKAKWVFNDAMKKPGTDTPTRLTDTLEWFGSSSTKIEIIPDPSGGAVNKPGISISGYLINLPAKVHQYEEDHKEVLFHTRAYYNAFVSPPPPDKQRIPRTPTGSFPGGEPVFCPPGSFS